MFAYAQIATHFTVLPDRTVHFMSRTFIFMFQITIILWYWIRADPL